MCLSRISYRLQSGFSLITMSIMLAVVGLVFASMLPGNDGSNYGLKVSTNSDKMERIEEAMRSFMAVNGRRPCPADGQYAVNTANFGVEAATPGTCTVTAGMMGPDAGTGYIVAGVIPTKALGLSDDYAVDAFGHRFTYVVDTRATSITTCSTVKTGGIKIESSTGGSLLAQTMYAFISHGASGYGAFPATGSIVANRINSGSTDGDMQTNAGVDAHFPGASAFTYSTANFTNVKVQKSRIAPTATDSGFDDFVWYRNDTKNTCGIGSLAKGVGFRIDGTASYPNLGVSLSEGDINGDGIQDMVIGANTPGQGDNGALIVVFGTAKGFPDPLPISTLNGTNGFILTYATAGDKLGTTLAVGDFNGDGYADILVGAGGASYSFATSGSAYLIYGGPTMKNGTAWSTCPCALAAGGSVINATNGFRIDGAAASDGLGYNGTKSLYFADVNGDNHLDILLGVSPEASNGAASGSVWVIYGNGAGAMKDGTAFAQTQTLALGTKPIDGTNGYRLDGATAGDWFGYSIAVADFNGDNKNDLIISASHAAYSAATAGSVYVIYGTGANLMPSGTITTANSSAAATVNSFAGLETGMYINTPKTAGLYISACGGSATCSSTSITLSGNATGVQTAVAYTVDAARVTANGTLIDGTHGFRLDGATAADNFGGSLTAGDFNGDGKADLLIGSLASYSAASSGSAYLVYGGATGKWYDGTALAATQTMTAGSKPINGTDGFRIDGQSASDKLSGTNSMLAIGDINGDGKADLILGAKTAAYNGANSGSVYVIYGNGAGAIKDGTAFAQTQTLSSGTKPIDGANGFRLDGRVTDYAGTGTVGPCIADVNNDGKADLLIGASYFTAGGSSPYYGSVWVLYGSFIPTITTSTYGLSNLCKGTGC